MDNKTPKQKFKPQTRLFPDFIWCDLNVYFGFFFADMYLFNHLIICRDKQYLKFFVMRNLRKAYGFKQKAEVVSYCVFLISNMPTKLNC